MRTLYLFVCLITVLSSCIKYEIKRADVPAPIRKKISTFALTACQGASVRQYDLRASKVFVFDDHCASADGLAYVLDEEGQDKCTLGGISGNMMCDSINFNTEAKNEVLIWKK